jgi:Na+/H+ antiporter NhaD/arsenite permease-like protein
LSILILFIFLIGYACIILEEWLTLDKTVPALLMGVLCWTGIALLEEGGGFNTALAHHIGVISEILLFLLGAMTIVELIDLHNGFDLIRQRISTQNTTRLLWIIAILSFLLSGILDNLTTAIVMVSILRKMIRNEEHRKYFAGIVIIAANAGGAWSPMGDVTTTMLWMDDRVSAFGLMSNGFLPALVAMALPTFIASFVLRKQTIECDDCTPQPETDTPQNIYGSKIILIVGLCALLFVPIFKIATGLPPYMGMLLGLGVCWLVGEILDTNRQHDDRDRYTVHRALQRIEISSILFFCGILLSIAALEYIDLLSCTATFITDTLPNMSFSIFLIGLLSAVVDNVPLVAAVMGMYPASTYGTDHHIWQFLAYCAGTGGSILIIGSAAGVAVMSTEHISFGWYARNIGWLALIGYVAGAILFVCCDFL